MSEFVRLPNTDEGDHGGVHLNSSIINHCFYLLAEGLPNALGLVDAERIFYRTLTRHLQAQSQFIDCRLGAIASAQELFGAESAHAARTAEAFDAVEIFAAPTTPEPTPVPVVQAEDSTLFIYPGLFGFGFDMGRREAALGDGNAGIVFAESVKLQRPAVSGDGSAVLFVDDSNDLCLVDTRNPFSRECFGFAGLVHAVALAPDLKYGAFVLRDPLTGQPDDSINVVELEPGTTRTYQLVSPAIDGVSVNQVLYADAMTFSTDGRELIYDALSRVKFGGAQTVERWSLSALNLVTGATRIIVPPLEGVDTGNPSAGRAGTRYLTFDALSGATGDSTIIVLDMFSGKLAAVGESSGRLGYPAFTGDEGAVIFAAPDGNLFGVGTSLARQGLSADRLGTVGGLTLWQEDALLGVVYRRGAFVSSNALPQVSLTAEPAAATAPATLTLRATATDSDGFITAVEFYHGNALLGQTTTGAANQYQFTWSSVGAGTYRLLARAKDNWGGSGDSAAVQVVVSPPGGVARPALTAALGANGQIILTVRGTAGSYFLQRSSDLVNWQDHREINLGQTGSVVIEEAAPASGGRGLFFRTRAR